MAAGSSGSDISGALERALEAVGVHESRVRAWAHIDPDAARARATVLERSDQVLPLRGLVLGVKDVFDTVDMPTEYGCRAYAGHRPSADAAAVAMLRNAGALCLGKTVTAELALFHPGPTTNPWRATHTPGGSSSGSAAAVAAGMADVALGTQTGGSVTRPASFCGVWGFKPTFGAVSVAGLKLVSPFLDTVGWFARSVDHLDAVRAVLIGAAPRPCLGPPRIGLARTAAWEMADLDCREAIELAAERAADAGAVVIEIDLPPSTERLTDEQPLIQAFEGARSLTFERTKHAAALSEALIALLDKGAAMASDEYERMRRDARRARLESDVLFRDVDVLLTPAAVGEAPLGLDSTGDPRFARLWTLLGLPALSVPGLSGATGLPIGVQLVGPWGADAAVIGYGEWLAEQF